MSTRLLIFFAIFQIPSVFGSSSFEGTAIINNCSAALIKLPDTGRESQAVILTNGHCSHLGFPTYGQAFLERRSKLNVTLYNNENRAYFFRTTKLIYATMTKTDIALYQLDHTYAELESLKIRPFEISRKVPEKGMEISIPSAYHYRNYRCQVAAIAFKLLEAYWTFEGSIRYSFPGCVTSPGASGAPILLYPTRIVIGVHNTYNKNGRFCSYANPCEMTPTGKRTAIKRAGYGQQVAFLHECFDLSFRFQANNPKCELPSVNRR